MLAYVASSTSDKDFTITPQPLPGCPLGSPNGAEPHAVRLSCFPLQCLLDQLLQQLREVTSLGPCCLLQPPKPGQVLAFYLAVPGLEVGALREWNSWSGVWAT